METKPGTYKNIDEYISMFPQDVQEKLQKVRETIRAAAPEAVETISYAMPAFKQHGVLVYFAALKNHIGFYPTPSGIEASKEELSEFQSTKGAVQFPLDKPIPYDVIHRVVQFRVKEDQDKFNAKKK